MENEKQVSPEATSEPTYLELLASLGMTRHLGGVDATDELIKLCQIGEGKRVLDVGCGIGKTACHLAKQFGCQVTGVDISPQMVEWSKERAKKERVKDRAEFRVADAQALPFEDNTFDVVINESVLAFVPDRRKALDEYVRVTEPGGYVGLNESIWIKTPVPPELENFLSRGFFAGARLESADTWKELLAGAGVKNIVVKIYKQSARRDLLDRLKWFGFRGVIRNLLRIISFSRQSPANKEAIKKILKLQRNIPQNFYEYYGYGIYIGQK